MPSRRSNPNPGTRIDGLGGTIERFTFRNTETGFAVVRFAPDGEKRPIPIVGALAQLTEGQHITICGTRREHPRFGPQIEVESAEAAAPATIEGIRAYLSSSLVKGIGPAMAARITEQFGEQTLEVIERQPERLSEVRGLGKRKIDGIIEALTAQRDVQDVMVFLRTHGLGEALAGRIVAQLGRNASALIEANPYRLADDVVGVGFKRADQLAMSIGIDAEDPARIAAGIEHCLTKAARDGHCFLPRHALREATVRLLGCGAELVDDSLPELEDCKRIIREPDFSESPDAEEVGGPQGLEGSAERDAFYPSTLHCSEVRVADRVVSLLRESTVPLPFDAGRALDWFAKQSGMHLPDGQRLAIHAALSEPVSVITGGPGVGKTTIIRALVQVLLAKNLRLKLAAPTGRAAKRLEESTGHGASTLHRLLEFQPGTAAGFIRDEGTPIDADLVVVDEASMLDIQLAEALLRAVQPQTKLVLVGDVDQLPSVGAGSVLADIIDSGRVKVTRLTEIFRQLEDSDIVRSAHAILRGDEPAGGGEGSDFYFVEARNGGHARKLIREIITERIPQAFGFDARRDVQVLCPMYRGDAGADALNQDLQQALAVETGPGVPEVRGLRLGDKVLQTRNNYDLDVFNGDAGTVRRVDPVRGAIDVDFGGGRSIAYAPADIDQLVPSYAITVHRSQGSEYPAVVIPVVNDHFMMLRRNLLYTAVTRGKRLVILVGTNKALRMAIDNNSEARRHTMLAARIRNAFDARVRDNR